jgi:RNA polymerase sigma-70 factor (ECF subfamily)
VRQNCAYKNATDRYEKSVSTPQNGFQESSTVDREVWKNELRQRMSQLMHKLPEAQRNAVRLTYYQGLSQREIAAHLSVPLGTIKTRIELGMRKLGRSLVACEAA